MTVETGQQAPDFSLPSTPGEDPVRLSDYRGEKHVVLLFFPLAWTSVCTDEMCAVRDDYDRYAGLDAQVLGISVDSPFALQAWSKEQDIPFPLLSDFNRDASRSYGVLYEDLMGLRGVAKRAAFVVDKAGGGALRRGVPFPRRAARSGGGAGDLGRDRVTRSGPRSLFCFDRTIKIG